VHRISPDGAIDAKLSGHRSVNECKIEFLDPTVGKLTSHGAMGTVVLCGNYESRRASVEAMDDAGTSHAADPAEIGTMVEQCIDQRPRGMRRRGVDDHVGRFIDHDEILVLEHNIDGNVFGLGLSGLGGWYFDFDFFTWA
jgi:hypothetical protein